MTGPGARGGWRRLLRAGGLASLAFVVLLVAGWGVMQTAPAKRWLAALLAEAVSTPGEADVSIGVLEGTLPFTVRMYGVRVADAAGPWLTLDDVDVVLRPLALFAGRAHVSRLAVGQAAILRMPANAAHSEPDGPPDLSFDLPSLPVALQVDGLRIERLVLEPAVLGSAAALTVAGEGVLDRDGARLRLDAMRVDGTAGEAHATLEAGRSTDVFTLALSLREPAGGLAARALAIPGLPPVVMELAGTGPANAWQGTLDATAGQGSVQAAIELALADGLSLSLQGHAQPQGFFDAVTAPLLPARLDVTATMRWEPTGAFEIERLALVAPEAAATLEGAIDPAADALRGTLDVTVSDAARWRGLITPAGVERIKASAVFTGTLRRPLATLRLAVEGISAEGVRAERLDAALDLEAPLDGGVVTSIEAKGSGSIYGLGYVQDPDLAAALGSTARWSADAAMDLAVGSVAVRHVQIEAGTVVLETSGQIGLAGPETDLSATLNLRDLAPLSGPIGMTVAGSLKADLRARGDLLAPRLAVDVSGRWANLVVDEPGASAFLGATPMVVGTLAVDGAIVTLDPMTVTGAGGTVTLRGNVDATGVGMDVTATVPEVAELARAYEENASGRLEANARIDGTLAGPDLAIVAAADLTDAALGDDVLDALTGGVVAASGLVLVQGATVLLDAARVEGRDVAVEGAGRLALPLDLQVRVTAPRLAALRRALGAELSGGLRAEGRVTGQLADPAVVARVAGSGVAVEGIALDGLTGTVEAHDLAHEPALRVVLDMRSPLGPTTATAGVTVARGGAISLHNMALAAPGTTVTGDLVVLPGGLARGDVAGRVDDLVPFGPLAGMTLGGAATFSATLASGGGRQDVTGTLRGQDLVAAFEEGVSLAAGTLALDVHMVDAFGAPSGSGTLEIDAARVGDATLASAKLAAEGDAGLLRLTGTAVGEAGRPVSVDLAGELAVAESTLRLRLDRLDGRYGTLAASLASPLAVEQGPGLLALTNLDAAVGEGRVAGEARLADGVVAARLAVDALPVGVLAALGGTGYLDGTVAADLALAGPASAPNLHVDVQLSDLREAGLAAGTALGIHGTLTADVANGRATLAATLGGPPELAVEVRAAAPATLSVDPFALDLAATGPLSGSVEAHADLGLLPQIADLRGDALGGQLDASMTLGGTLGTPDLRGTAQVTGGSFASAAAGTVLAAVEARLHGDQGRIVLDSLTASDGGSGRLQAAGAFDLARGVGRAAEIEATLSRFRIVRRPAATADVSGTVRLARSAEGASLAGAITVDSAELRIPERRPAGFVTLPVTEINRPPGRERPVPEGPAEPTVPVALDVRVHAPGRVFLRGRGLNSEWQGDLRILGTVDAPDVVGELRIVRGDFLFIDKEFRVETGVVGFVGGGDIDPNLNFSAVAETPDVTARVRVTGQASAPEFALTSEPALPEDEILSRLLFGKDAGGLSAAQAVQLAQVAAELSGTGRSGGMLDGLRRGIGLDALGFGTDEDTGDSTLSAGKYVSDEVYVRVQQGLTPESRTVGVEVRVLPQVVVEGDVGGEGDGRVGVNWRYDY